MFQCDKDFLRHAIQLACICRINFLFSLLSPSLFYHFTGYCLSEEEKLIKKASVRFSDFPFLPSDIAANVFRLKLQGLQSPYLHSRNTREHPIPATMRWTSNCDLRMPFGELRGAIYAFSEIRDLCGGKERERRGNNMNMEAMSQPITVHRLLPETRK